MNDTHRTKREKKVIERKCIGARTNEWMHSRKDAAAFKEPNFLKWNWNGYKHSSFFLSVFFHDIH